MSIRSWWRRCQRRKPGIYLARTEKHRRPGRYENGYVGESRHLKTRRGQHLGRLQYSTELGRSVPASTGGKPWADLDPRWYALRLPWWLGWKWVLRPIEWLAIKLLMPRYNDRHNRRNPRRVPLWVQNSQRAARDAGPVRVRAVRSAARWVYAAYQVVGLALILGGFAGWIITR